MALSAEVEKQIKDMGEKIAKLEADKAAADARAAIAKADTAEALDVVIKGLTEAVAKVVAVDVEARKADLAKVKDGEAVKKFAEKLSDPLKVAFSKLNTKEQAEFMTSYKADGDPVAKALEEVTKQNATLAKQVADLGADAELRKTEDELKDLAGGPVNVAELAKTLVALRKHDKAAADAMLTQIRATAKQAQAGNVFRVIGKDGDGAGDAMGEIDKKAEAYAKEHKVTKAVATGAVLKIEPELYDRYLAEKREA